MLNLMKIAILIIVCSQIFALNSNKVDAVRTENKGFYYSYSDPVYNSYTPVYYTYTPSSYYYTSDPNSSVYYGSTAYPTTYSYTSYPYYWRKGDDNKNAPNHDEIEKELHSLKKEIWGNENYNTDQTRKDGKAYDSRWLIAQLKISRALELEDLIKEHSNEPKNRENMDEVSISSDKESLRTESEPKKEKKNKDGKGNREEIEEMLRSETVDPNRKDKPIGKNSAKKIGNISNRNQLENESESERSETSTDSDSERTKSSKQNSIISEKPNKNKNSNKTKYLEEETDSERSETPNDTEKQNKKTNEKTVIKNHLESREDCVDGECLAARKSENNMESENLKPKKLNLKGTTF